MIVSIKMHLCLSKKEKEKILSHHHCFRNMTARIRKILLIKMMEIKLVNLIRMKIIKMKAIMELDMKIKKMTIMNDH